MKNFVAVYIILAIFCMQLEGMENNSISYEFKSRITALAVAQDGDSLVVGLETGQVTFFDIKKSELFSYWSNKTPVTALAMGNYIAVGYENGDLCVLDSKMRELYDLERHEKAIKKVVVDGTFMASFDNECAKIWDLLNGRCIAVLSFKKSVQAVALSRQYRHLKI